MTSAKESSTAASGAALPGAAAITVKNLSHVYPATKKRRGESADRAPSSPALSDVSFTVEPGEIFGILGPNGGGKTTLFRILSTIMQPNHSGDGEPSVRIFDNDVLRHPASVRQTLGVVFQMPSIDGSLTANENLMHQGHLYGLKGDALKQRSDELFEFFGLRDRCDENVERFSGGMRRRVELAKSLLHKPRLLLLDEPSTGLDPGARADLWAQLEQLRSEQSQTVALTTHLMEEADRCDRLAILSKGKLVAVDTPDNLKQRIGGDVVTVATADSDVQGLCIEIPERFAPWHNNEPRVVDRNIHLERNDGAAFVAELATAFTDRFTQISVGKPTLDDVFLHLTGHTLWDGKTAD